MHFSRYPCIDVSPAYFIFKFELLGTLKNHFSYLLFENLKTCTTNEKLQVTLYFLKFFDVSATNIGTYRSQIFPQILKYTRGVLSLLDQDTTNYDFNY